jgi:hypothetical protein
MREQRSRGLDQGAGRFFREKRDRQAECCRQTAPNFAGNVVNLKKKPLMAGTRFVDATRGSADNEVNGGGAVVAAFN